MIAAMPRFLSDEWLRRLEAAAAGDERVRAATADAALTVQHIVHGGPDGELAYHVRLHHGAVSVRPGRAAGADATVVEDYELAAALSRGELAPGPAFASGRLKVAGDVGRLAA